MEPPVCKARLSRIHPYDYQCPEPILCHYCGGKVMDLFRRLRGSAQDEEGRGVKKSTADPLPSGDSGEKPVKKIRIPLNKTTRDVKTDRDLIIFPCPLCETLNTVHFDEIHPILGGQPMCQNCQGIFHIPGGYRTGSEVSSLSIYAALPVAIRKFYLFYQNHPVIHSLEEQGITRIIIQYGIWGFCQKCHHEFSPAVLMNLPQTSQEIVDLRSLSSDEMVEMQSLRRGQCPYCSHNILLVIISEVPHYVISASENLSHRWEDD